MLEAHLLKTYSNAFQLFILLRIYQNLLPPPFKMRVYLQPFVQLLLRHYQNASLPRLPVRTSVSLLCYLVSRALMTREQTTLHSVFLSKLHRESAAKHIY